MILPTTLSLYAASREDLLLRIHKTLEVDPRFIAAWLGGSYGRGTQDAVSDLDLFVVIKDEFSYPICRRQAAVASGSILERMELFQMFGEPANIHENHNNAPLNGTFSAVLYHHPPVIVDWVLVPQSSAVRPNDTRLLFDKAGIPLQNFSQAKHEQQEKVALLAEKVAFFSMMAAVIAKYIIRRNNQRVQELLEFVEPLVYEIDALSGQPQSKAIRQIFPDWQAQSKQLRFLCDRVERVLEADRADLPIQIPRGEIEAILTLESDTLDNH